eukprot:CAMPEP_0197643566 /NCGR_PEP_ID=MMETSP1338-20131121/16838_1 /TAXON_ID=43686 ORGANISM="Pelagodinium beii, Strain RCC1491" /NCGR_SAMPLE_ID=MMETSP1338 /ASSEMBLY_ACC=CAM_ASM_000754 /LENGTH=256 /DNA_ID=CAMNT_0043216831 /DNA_START=46 /DNA_END=813 /DNA_ORIENTATION=+
MPWPPSRMSGDEKKQFSLPLDGILSPAVLSSLEQFLSSQSLSRIQESSPNLAAELTPFMNLRRHDEWTVAVSIACARQHFEEILNSDNEGTLLCRRRCLVRVDQGTQLEQWRTPTAVARLMNGVSMDGSDLFAALKRTFLASQVPSFEKLPAVVYWMHVLGAIEEQDPVQSKLLAAEAFSTLASDGQISEGNVHWAVQAAHFVDDLDNFSGWLLVEGGPSVQELTAWLAGLDSCMGASPNLGRYGPAGDTSQLRSR